MGNNPWSKSSVNFINQSWSTTKHNFFDCDYDCIWRLCDQWNHQLKIMPFEVVMSNQTSLNCKDKVEELARPCLDMLNRLTYEVTEIAMIYRVLIWSLINGVGDYSSSTYLPPSTFSIHDDLFISPILSMENPMWEGRIWHDEFYDGYVLRNFPPTECSVRRTLIWSYTHALGLFLSSENLWIHKIVIFEGRIWEGLTVNFLTQVPVLL